jgi:preprotein translocase subunit SecG
VNKLKRTLILVTVWLIATILYAYYYIVSILARREEFDAYAMNWQFQLLMFSLVRLPFLLLVLAVLIAIVLVLPSRTKSRSSEQ